MPLLQLVRLVCITPLDVAMATTDLPIPIPSAVTSRNWLGMAKSAGALVASAAALFVAVVVRTISVLFVATTWLMSMTYAVAAWPLSRLFAILRVLCSPVTYTVSYALIPFNATLSFLGRLRPLYTYLGSAAFIGIVAGLALKLASDYIVVVLSLDAATDQADETEPKSTAKTTSSSYTTTTSAQTGSSRTALTAPSTAPTASTRRLPKSDDDQSDIVQDDVWQWLEEFNPWQPAVGAASSSSANVADAPSLLPKQRPPGLLSLTILEESSSDGGLA